VSPGWIHTNEPWTDIYYNTSGYRESGVQEEEVGIQSNDLYQRQRQTSWLLWHTQASCRCGGMNALIELEGSQTKGYFGLHTSDSFHPRKNLFLLTMVEELWW
jgi:hypothetical protein